MMDHCSSDNAESPIVTDEGDIEPTYASGHHPNQVAHHFKPGEAANPLGRPKGSLFPGEALRMLLKTDESGIPAWPPARIRKMVEDESAHPALIAAGRELLSAMSDGKKWITDKGGQAWLAGIDPEVGRAFERTSCRLEGKPQVSILMEHRVETKPVQLGADLVALLRQDPRLIKPLWPRILGITRSAPTVRDQLRPLLAQHAPDLAEALDPIETTAAEVPATQVAAALPSPAEQDAPLFEPPQGYSDG